MTRYLIVANQTLGGEELVAWMDKNLDARAQVRLVVPVTDTQGAMQWEYPPIHQAIKDAHAMAHKLAEARLNHELERLEGLGVSASGEVVDPDPIDHIKGLLDADGADIILVSTLPHRLSRWLRADLPHRLQRAIDQPVDHVQSSAGPSI